MHHGGQDAKSLIDAVVGDVEAFSTPAEQHDDMTSLAVRKILVTPFGLFFGVQDQLDSPVNRTIIWCVVRCKGPTVSVPRGGHAASVSFLGRASPTPSSWSCLWR